jgi:hypothetical protein
LALSLVSLTPETLSRDLGEPVEEVMVIIGKHEVMGFDSKSIAELLGVTQEEVDQVRELQLYKNMLLLMKVEQSKGRIDTDNYWDAIEQVGLERLFERVKIERDGDFLLKVAAVANKAQRRTRGEQVLDPAAAGTRIPLTLSRRIVKKLHSDGTSEEGIEETMRINDGRMVHPTFGDVDALLSVSQKPFLPKDIAVKTVVHDPTVEELMDGFESDSW